MGDEVVEVGVGDDVVGVGVGAGVGMAKLALHALAVPELETTNDPVIGVFVELPAGMPLQFNVCVYDWPGASVSEALTWGVVAE